VIRMKEKILSKRGFTLTELMVSIIFIVVIIGTATYAWYVSNVSFGSTKKVSEACSQARSLESMIHSAASTSASLLFREEQLTGYSHFYFDDGVYKVILYGNESIMTPVTMEFDAIDEVKYQVIDRGRKCELTYKIESSDEEGPFYIQGGIILNNIEPDNFRQSHHGYTTLPQVLNFEVPEP